MNKAHQPVFITPVRDLVTAVTLRRHLRNLDHKSQTETKDRRYTQLASPYQSVVVPITNSSLLTLELCQNYVKSLPGTQIPPLTVTRLQDFLSTIMNFLEKFQLYGVYYFYSLIAEGKGMGYSL